MGRCSIQSKKSIQFSDRATAGELLAKELIGYREKDVVVQGISDGGVITAHPVADALDGTLDIKCFSERVPLANRVVILVDDGVVTGRTMEAAILDARQYQPKKIIVAVPVGPEEVIRKISKLADETFCLVCPSEFAALDQFYEIFPEVQGKDITAIVVQEIRRDCHAH